MGIPAEDVLGEHRTRHKVNRFLYSRETAINFRGFQNDLVAKEILCDDDLDQHHGLIDALFLDWRTGFEAEHTNDRQQQMLTSPQTPESFPPQAALPPPQEDDAPTATIVEMLEQALESIDPDWPWKDGAITGLLLPGHPVHRSVAVNRIESSLPESYIQASTLNKRKIKCKGPTINLDWKSLGPTRNSDQTVQKTCFHVIDETAATQAGFGFDMIVGTDHSLPLKLRTWLLERMKSGRLPLTGVLLKTFADLPLHVAARPLDLSARPLDIAARRLGITSRPLGIAARSLLPPLNW
ncbi:hypothetical protein INS49_006052 [Diaporthe citri]|uniref:uncharacterized protein n=1 Tax=Diaporthe citri TaxID=83186 RepID=UPI001C7F0B2C|nr:uncharacterized protein INS49_006052 [Diaporthe citri]KAG6364451.1 hypothetical protein INS49_006052 [Diaporthe citri]